MKPLHNLEAEQALLGAILFDNRLLERLSSLQAEHFFDPVHGRVFERIRAHEGVADAVTLRAWADADASMKQIGGGGYLLTLVANAAPLSSQALAYAETIRDLSARRVAQTVLTATLERLEEHDSLLEVLGDSETALRALMETGEPDAVDVAASGESFVEGMGTLALQTGIAALDHRLGGLHKSDLVILAGRPSMGKTALAAQIARNVAEQGRIVHFASLEMPKEQLACRAISAFSMRRQSNLERLHYYHLRNGSNVDRRLIRSLLDELPRGLLIDDRAAQTLAMLENSVRGTRRRFKRLDLVVVDYLQLMRSLRKDGRVNEVTEISQGLKAIAKRLSVPVIALSQLSRGVEGRDNKRPTLADLRDSGAIEQDADAVLACYRPAYYLEREEPSEPAQWAAWEAALEKVRRDFEVITLKQRAGPIGTDKLEAWLEFDVVRDRVAA